MASIDTAHFILYMSISHIAQVCKYRIGTIASNQIHIYKLVETDCMVHLNVIDHPATQYACYIYCTVRENDDIWGHSLDLVKGSHPNLPPKYTTLMNPKESKTAVCGTLTIFFILNDWETITGCHF